MRARGSSYAKRRFTPSLFNLLKRSLISIQGGKRRGCVVPNLPNLSRSVAELGRGDDLPSIQNRLACNDTGRPFLSFLLAGRHGNKSVEQCAVLARFRWGGRAFQVIDVSDRPQ